MEAPTLGTAALGRVGLEVDEFARLAVPLERFVGVMGGRVTEKLTQRASDTRLPSKSTVRPVVGTRLSPLLVNRLRFPIVTNVEISKWFVRTLVVIFSWEQPFANEDDMETFEGCPTKAEGSVNAPKLKLPYRSRFRLNSVPKLFRTTPFRYSPTQQVRRLSKVLGVDAPELEASEIDSLVETCLFVANPHPRLHAVVPPSPREASREVLPWTLAALAGSLESLRETKGVTSRAKLLLKLLMVVSLTKSTILLRCSTQLAREVTRQTEKSLALATPDVDVQPTSKGRLNRLLSCLILHGPSLLGELAFANPTTVLRARVAARNRE